MKKQRILSLLLALAMTFSLLPGTALAAKTEDFTDVSKSDWFYKYVDFVVDKEYFAGTSKTTFSPEMSMTRAMFVVVLAAVEGVEVDNNVSPFADVPANTWYSGAVEWAAEKGVVAGVGGNKFAPDTAISREQMAVMMNAYVDWHSKKTGEEHKEKSKVDSFKDEAKISSWAEEAVENCRNWGLIAGAPDGNYYPQNTATRAEVATVIYNLAWLINYGGGGSFPSGPSNPTCVHDWVMTYDDIKHWEKCSKCSATQNDGNHDMGEWDVIKEANHVEAGEKRRDCSVCDYYETEVIDPQPYDYIYKALEKTIAAIQEDVADNFEGNTIPESATVGGSKTYVKIEGLTLGDENAVGTNGQPHPITIKATADIDSNTLCAIAEYAVSNAIELTGAAVSKAPTKAEAKEMVKETVSLLESKLGVDLKLSKESIAEVAEIVYNIAKDKADKAADYGVAYGKSLRENFIGDLGGYVTGNVIISVGGNTVELNVEENSVSLANTTKTKAVAAIASGMAKELYNGLKDQCSDYTNLNDIVLKTTVDVDFSGNETYAPSTSLFPYCYPVTFELSMVKCETSVGDNIQYKYDNGHFINIKVTEAAKAEYAKLVELAIEEIKSSETVKAELEKLMKKAGVSQEDMSATVMGTDEDPGMGQTIVNALESMGMSDAESEVTASINDWLAINLPDDVTESPMIDLIMNGTTAEGSNDDLYDLVTKSAMQAHTYISTSRHYGVMTKLAQTSTPAEMKSYAEDYDEFSAMLEPLEKYGIADYVFAVITDELNRNPETGNCEIVVYDPITEEPIQTVIKEYTKIPNKETGLTPVESMKASVDDMVYDMAVDAIKSNTTDSQQEVLKALDALRSIDTAKDLELGQLASILPTSAAKKIMDKYEDTVVERITALIRYIPDEASIVLPNGVEVKESTLSKVRDAKTFGEACSATADLLKNFAGLSLSSFAESKDITVKYDGQNKDIEITVGLMITID